MAGRLSRGEIRLQFLGCAGLSAWRPAVTRRSEAPRTDTRSTTARRRDVPLAEPFSVPLEKAGLRS
jgi:hypothetical protein